MAIKALLNDEDQRLPHSNPKELVPLDLSAGPSNPKDYENDKELLKNKQSSGYNYSVESFPSSNGSSSQISIMIGDGTPSASEIEAEQRSPVNQMDSTGEATVSPRGVSVPSASNVSDFTRFLNGLGAIGSIEIIELSLNLYFQMTACVGTYYIYLNSGSSSAPQLSKPHFYSIVATNTVGFLASGVGIAIHSRPAGSILGGIGAILAASTFLLIMSTFISTI